MPNVEAYESTLELTVPVLEATNEGTSPVPRLEDTGTKKTQAFRELVLENEYLRVSILPELGGRIAQIYDKRTSIPLFDLGAASDTVPCLRRGVCLDFGLDFRLESNFSRWNSLALTDFLIDQEEDSAAIWIGDIEADNLLSFHLKYTLKPGTANLEIESRTLNRGDELASYSPSFRISGHFERCPYGMYNSSRKAGFGVHSLAKPLEIVPGEISRFGEGSNYELIPGQFDAFSFVLTPITALGEVNASLPAGALSIDSLLKIQLAQPVQDGKVFLLTERGESMEAPVQGSPETITKIDLGQLKAKKLEVRNGLNELILAWPLDEFSSPFRPDLPPELPSLENADDCLQWTSSATFRGFATTNLGILELADGDFERAASSFESALLYDGDNHLLWWAKATALRLAKVEGDEHSLPNAHFLAPLEPVLRAESFLGQPASKTPSALVAPFAENPARFLDVAQTLLQHNLYADTARWLEEALRHVDLAPIRYLLAWCLFRSPDLAMEAGAHVAAAAKLPIGLPRPWRSREKQALAELVKRFRTDQALQRWSELANRS